jgi:hypothetical protein
MFRTAIVVAVFGLLLANAPPVSADPPQVSVVDVQRGDGVQVVFVGGRLEASQWWAPPAPVEYFQEAMEDIVAFFDETAGATANPLVVVFTNVHIGSADATPPGLIRIGLGTLNTPEDTRRVLAHEYYHVLQFGAAGGGLGWPGTPAWMFEGSAKRSELLYQGLAADERRDFLIKGAVDRGALCDGGDPYMVGALAIDWLTEQSGVDPLRFYSAIGPPPRYGTDAYTDRGTRWQGAFEETYGLHPDEFCTDFEVWRAEQERDIAASFTPHLADDVIEPVVEIVGRPSDTAHVLRAEVGLLQEHWLNRYGAAADYTVRIVEGDASRSIRGLPRSYAGSGSIGPCVSNSELAGLIVLNATCDWADPNHHMSVLRGFHHTMVIAHASRNIPSATYSLPIWFDWGFARYASHHYNITNGGHTQDREEALRSLRRVGSLRDASLDRSSDLRGAGFLAIEWLANHAGEHAVIDFYRALGEQARDPKNAARQERLGIELANAAAWQAAFETAFGMSVDDFYDQFEQYRRDSTAYAGG